MNKAQETVEMFNDLGGKGYDNLRRLGELQMATWNGLMERQMSVFGRVVDSAVAQVKLAGEGKEPQEMLRGQMELNRQLAEQMMEAARESVELMQKNGEEFREWAEEAIKQATTEAEKMSEKVAA